MSVDAIQLISRAQYEQVSHNAYDDAVSVFYGCALASRMQALGGQARVDVWSDRSAGHAIKPGFAAEAWTFLAAHPMPPTRR